MTEFCIKCTNKLSDDEYKYLINNIDVMETIGGYVCSDHWCECMPDLAPRDYVQNCKRCATPVCRNCKVFCGDIICGNCVAYNYTSDGSNTELLDEFSESLNIKCNKCYDTHYLTLDEYQYFEKNLEAIDVCEGYVCSKYWCLCMPNGSPYDYIGKCIKCNQYVCRACKIFGGASYLECTTDHKNR